MATEYLRPDEIEKRSFEIIKSELPHEPAPELAPVILRVIHTTADFDYLKSLRFSQGVIEHAVAALRRGVGIVSDTGMVRAGVDKNRLKLLGCELYCFMQDDEVAKIAAKDGTTRARAAVDKAALMGMPLIFAIGNAPTALLRVCELKEKGVLNPELVIGVPVGFVNVVESKEMLMQSDIPYIASTGRKGGSNVAAAICNALLRIALPAWQHS